MNDIEEVLEEIERLIAYQETRAQAMGIDPFKMMDASGNLMLAPLVVAKAHALHARVLLESR